MESILYSIMDQRLEPQLTKYVRIGLGYNRTESEMSFRTYIISDQFRLGTSFQKEIGRISNVLISFAAEGSGIVSNTYHRFGPLRAQEYESFPFMRSAINRWFGIFPLLTSILPPSFLPEEMYNPISLLSTLLLIPNTH